MNSVNHPNHYNSGRIEVIEAIEDWGLGFNLGNVIKYVARAGKKNKDKYIEDLQKAAWYLQRELKNACVDEMCRYCKHFGDADEDGLGYCSVMEINTYIDEKKCSVFCAK